MNLIVVSENIINSSRYVITHALKHCKCGQQSNVTFWLLRTTYKIRRYINITFSKCKTSTPFHMGHYFPDTSAEVSWCGHFRSRL